MKKFIYLLCILLLAISLSSVAAQEDAVISRLQAYNLTLPQGYGLMTVEDLTKLLVIKPETVLLDVRQPEEYAAGHLEDAINVPLRELVKNLNLLPDLNADIVVICQGGGRATLAATTLGILGYEHVRILRGGYAAWEFSGQPTTTEAHIVEANIAPEFDAAVFDVVDSYLTTLPQDFGFVLPQNLAIEPVDNPSILIDVRSREEWNSGYIRGARNIWINEFISRQNEWPADKNAYIVIYCGSGYRGSIATVLMRLAGYTHVRNLSGGVNAWADAGLPLFGVMGDTPDLNPDDSPRHTAWRQRST